MTCAHLTRAAESVAVTPDGHETPVVVHLCTWADGNPARLVDAPRWLTYRALAGEPVQPERDCVGCPGFKQEART